MENNILLSDSITTEALRYAYTNGYFPMWNDYTRIMEWHNPDPRAIFLLDRIKVSKSLRQALKRNNFTYTVNQAFHDVIKACADREDCWINDDIIEHYTEFHKQGNAHSFEVWSNDTLVGGLYGISAGAAFCGESMFSRVSDASKCTFVFSCVFLSLCGFHFVDSQYINHHTELLGAFEIPKREYLERLENALSVGYCFDVSKSLLIQHPIDCIERITLNS